MKKQPRATVIEDPPQREQQNEGGPREFVGPSIDKIKETFFDPAMRRSYRIHMKHHYPRAYYISFHLVAPLLCLIGMCFLFGWMLARVEMGVEIQKNNEALREVYQAYTVHQQERDKIYEAMANTTVQCITEAMRDEALLALSLSGTMDDLRNCSLYEGKRRFPYMSPLVNLVTSNPSLTFHWLKCDKPPKMERGGEMNYEELIDHYFPLLDLNKKDNRDRQIFRYFLAFDLNVRFIQSEAIRLTPDITFDEDTLRGFIGNATGAAGCKVHTAGGALFWFTIMTTIGYGNTAPTTDEGRLLVFVCGFATIIGFLILNHTAAQVWKYLLEDIFLTYRMKALVTGLPSVLFWLCLTFMWMLVIAASMVGYQRRMGEDFALKDAYWFSYITTTTVGLGDIHFAHEEFTAVDMFYIPLIVLMGFNFLDIFAGKGRELYNKHFPERTDFNDILEARRALARAGVPFYNEQPSSNFMQEEPSTELSLTTQTPQNSFTFRNLGSQGGRSSLDR